MRASKFLVSSAVHQSVEVAVGVELAAFVVEAVGEFVADDGADVAVVDGVVGFGVVEGGLQDAGGEVDVVHAGVVVGVDGGRASCPTRSLSTGLPILLSWRSFSKALARMRVADGVVAA